MVRVIRQARITNADAATDAAVLAAKEARVVGFALVVLRC